MIPRIHISIFHHLADVIRTPGTLGSLQPPWRERPPRFSWLQAMEPSGNISYPESSCRKWLSEWRICLSDDQRRPQWSNENKCHLLLWSEKRSFSYTSCLFQYLFNEPLTYQNSRRGFSCFCRRQTTSCSRSWSGLPSSGDIRGSCSYWAQCGDTTRSEDK